MVTLAKGGAWLVNGREVVQDGPEAEKQLAAMTGQEPSREEAKKNTIAYAEKNGMPRSPRKRMPRLRPRNARVPGTTSVISGTPGHYWLHKKRQRPTLPPGGAVPSARAGLTSLFGMGRGGSPRL